ncbi:MD-2-related lipid-recognition protein 3 [Raphanus sativus]|uniref:MD-2-related lipid-recognition protein 3 n=1 Tax=Raphanus sativus TaxID=3726 RepID=A0A6J0MBJ9_RAPSA|nr:MD-2-related lipid-recognition protein 3 [Raphanus sativus]
MAISHVQPLLLLLGSLFFLPALRAINFEYCNKSGYDFGTVTRVEISPNPVGPNDGELSIAVFGHAKESIHAGSIEVYAKSENITDLLRQSTLCVVSEACAIESGTNFVLPLPGVPKEILEGDYKYVVSLLDEKVGDSKEATVRMCVDFSLPTSSSILASA